MNKSTITKILIHIYMIMVLLGILLWLPFPELAHIIGACSIVQAFLIAVGDIPPLWLSYLSLIWIVVFCLSLVISYIVACWKNKYKPILSIMGIELLVAASIIFYLIWLREFYLFPVILTGYIIRFLYFIGVVYTYKIARRQKV